MTVTPTSLPIPAALDEGKPLPMASHLFYVPSMHCAGCMAKIERKINGLHGVASARVNLSRKELRVTSAPSLRSEAIVAAMDSLGFAAEEINLDHLPQDDRHDASQMLKRLAVAGFGMMNVMLLSVAIWSGADATTRQFLHLISALVALPVLIYSAQPFFANAWRALRRMGLNMDVPISLAILLAGGASLYESLTAGDHAYFDAALALTFFLLGGRYLDVMARQKARSAAAQLARIQSPLAWQKKDGKFIEIAVSALEPEMVVVVRPGERIPIDGTVIKGRSDCDRSFLTGESEPVSVVKGADVFAGETCLNGYLEIKVTKAAEESLLSRFIDLVDIAERGRDRYNALADRAAAIYAPLVHILAFVAFAFWLWKAGDVHLALTIAISVLIITCPCALGLAVPAVMTASSGRLFAHGVLLKNATALERIAAIDTVVFDKTGTLTTGQFQGDDFKDWDQHDLAVLRQLAMASHHPLAKSIAETLSPRTLPPVEVTAIEETPGSGISGRYAGAVVKLGKPSWLSPQENDQTDQRRLGFRLGRNAVRWMAFQEKVKPETEAMLRQLDELGIKRVLLTGDHETAAAEMAKRLNFNAHHGRMTPAEKLDIVNRLKADGASVLMVGDGLNDTGAMAAADSSVAPASALDAARATADVVLLGGHLKALPLLVTMARVSKRRIIQNFAAAALYNVIAVPLALVGLATPLLAAIAMSASSITVVLNAVRPSGLARFIPNDQRPNNQRIEEAKS